MDAIKIQALLREMDTSMRRHRGLKNTNPPEYAKKIESENSVLLEAYPVVFDMHLNGKLDGTFFEMLKLKRKIEKGEMTVDEASKVVGQQLFDRYVGPVVGAGAAAPHGSTTPLSYQEYYNQFNKNE